jgi:tRNA dimethylallyltransferase
MKRQRVIAIVGPTASGKSAWAVRLAKEFNGVVISADSRQVYKGLNIATAKITKSEMDGIPHYLLDVVKPTEDFDVSTYQNLVYILLKKIGSQKLPIVAGGTGLYVQAVTDGYVFSNAEPDLKLRAKLAQQPLERSVLQLKKLAPGLEIDFKNPRRVIRALEIVIQQGTQPAKQDPGFDTLKIGIKISPDEREKRITKRIKQMDFDGLAEETKKLIRAKFDFTSNPLTALYYRFAKEWLENKITKPELIEKIIRADNQYAKRQMTWFKKDRQIHWVTSYAELKKLAKKFLADEA